MTNSAKYIHKTSVQMGLHVHVSRGNPPYLSLKQHKTSRTLMNLLPSLSRHMLCHILKAPLSMHKKMCRKSYQSLSILKVQYSLPTINHYCCFNRFSHNSLILSVKQRMLYKDILRDRKFRRVR